MFDTVFAILIVLAIFLACLGLTLLLYKKTADFLDNKLPELLKRYIP